MDLSAIDAVLLDMDGTLVDSDAAVERAWATWADEYGADVDAVLEIAHGSPAERTVRRIRPDLADDDAKAAGDRQVALQYDDLSDVVATPGALELVALLDHRGIPWAVVTSADRRLAAARLGVVGIAAPVLVTVEDITAGKPDPEGYLKAAGLLGVDIARCLVVEDAEPGIEAGRAAGAAVAALKGLRGDLALTDLGELARLLVSAGKGEAAD
jgi:sugar-phosphatase